MGFMGMFGGKKSTGSEGGDWGSDQVGMMKMLAGMPHMMRKPMMKGRINQLLSLTEENRQESIREMIGVFDNPEWSTLIIGNGPPLTAGGQSRQMLNLRVWW